MNKILNWVLAATLVCSASVYTSCSSNDIPVEPTISAKDTPPEINVAEKIIGKWMVAELDGEPCPTNWKTVLTFESPTQAYGSLSDYYSLSWNERVEGEVKINANKVSIVNQQGNTKNVFDCTVLSISNTEMVISSDWNVYVDGKSVQHEVYGKER